EIAQANWMDIALTDYNFYAESYVKYQYRLNNSHWHTIPTPLIQLNGVVSGEHLIEYRKSNNDVDWTEPKQFSFKVTGPWYNSDAAMLVYTLIASVLILFIVIFSWRWVLSFHRVFRSYQKQVQQEGLRSVLWNLKSGLELCSSNDTTFVTEGLVKLNEAADALLPIANSHASLGKQSLSEGLMSLEFTCKGYGKSCDFEITLGNAYLDHSLECDIYSVISHASINAMEHSKGTKLSVFVNKMRSSVNIEIIDDGVGMGIVNRTVNFGLGHYVIKRIAKAHNTKAKWKSSKKGTSLKIEFPLKLKSEMPKSIRDMFTETE
ncbi:hypothetical protein CJF42_25960, partial [Pseudoalteromonas sp. NBT06-2]|uniref:ATP-binding protein n=1 Tax=Pseudoalteromonas sp. NBT06-2 TaxID=2025950 RepID=UPI000BCEDCCC